MRRQARDHEENNKFRASVVSITNKTKKTGMTFPVFSHPSSRLMLAIIPIGTSKLVVVARTVLKCI